MLYFAWKTVQWVNSQLSEELKWGLRFSLIDDEFRYTPFRRRLFRELVGTFLVLLEPAYVCNCVESEVAAFFANKHIAAYLPNEAMQEGAAWARKPMKDR